MLVFDSLNSYIFHTDNYYVIRYIGLSVKTSVKFWKSSVLQSWVRLNIPPFLQYLHLFLLVYSLSQSSAESSELLLLFFEASFVYCYCFFSSSLQHGCKFTSKEKRKELYAELSFNSFIFFTLCDYPCGFLLRNWYSQGFED